MRKKPRWLVARAIAVAALLVATAGLSPVTPIVPGVVEVPTPPPSIEDPDLDETNDDTDYLEGFDRGFAALRVGEHSGRNFGVMEALDQMEIKGTCILL